MKYEISFSYIAWSDYLDWQKQDKKMFKKINLLIESICRDNLLGKPEKLKVELTFETIEKKNKVTKKRRILAPHLNCKSINNEPCHSFKSFFTNN